MLFLLVFLYYLCCFHNYSCQFTIQISCFIFTIPQSLDLVPAFELKFSNVSSYENTFSFQESFTLNFRIKFDSACCYCMVISYYELHISLIVLTLILAIMNLISFWFHHLVFSISIYSHFAFQRLYS